MSLSVSVSLLLAAFVGGLCWFVSAIFARRRREPELAAVGDKLIAMQREADQARTILSSAQAAAARLPDALARAERAEESCAQLVESNRELIAKESALNATLSATESKIEGLIGQVGASESRRENLESNLANLRNDAAAATAALATGRNHLVEVAGQRDLAVQELSRIRDELFASQSLASKLRAELDASVNAHDQTKAFLSDAQTKLRSAFIEAASKVFDEKSLALEQKIKDSSENSRVGFEATLKPFSEQVGQFQARIEALASDHARDFAKFEGSVSTIQRLNQNMADATNSLARALKGNAKVRGDWGEVILETVLKASGLVEKVNYLKQKPTTDEESGKKRTPDIVINLPDGRQVVVDSKVSLVAWSEANNADTPEAYEDAMTRHTASVKQHMRDLAERNYPKVVGPQALDMTIMFVPIEGALSAALSTNADLQAEAFGRRVVFASPNTLMAMLRVVERLWTRDRLQRQVDTIGTQAGKVVDALIDFLSEFDDIQKCITRADAAFKTAKNRLHESDRSVLSRAQRLVQAGAKSRKQIPEVLQAIGAATPLLELAGSEDAQEDVAEGVGSPADEIVPN